MSVKNRAAAVACGLALAATVFAPVSAFAADTDVTSGNTGSTEVTIISEKSDKGGLTGDDQLAFSVPTQIAFAAKADGTLVGPSKEATKITNKSVFGIHVTNMAVAEQSPWKLVGDASASAETNAFSISLNNVAAASSVDLSDNTAWNMTYAGSAGDSVELESAGKIANVDVDLASAQKVATITWTLAAGNAK